MRIAAARDNARGVRDTISSEMWECLNVTWHALASRRLAAERLGPNVFLSYVRERSAVLAGLTESTMSRDDGWRFLVLGRSLERVDMTARLVSIQAHTPDEDTGWRTVLRACGADEAFLRTHGGTFDPQLVSEFLLLDRLFPRSALHALGTAEQCLRELAPSTERAGMTDAARRPIGQIRTRLEYADTSTLLADLPQHLRALQQTTATPRARPSPLATSRSPPRSPGAPPLGGPNELATEDPARDRLQVRGDRLRLVQRSPADAADPAVADHAVQPGRGHAGRDDVPLLRLLGHPGHRVRRAPAAPATARRVQQPGRVRAARRAA